MDELDPRLRQRGQVQWQRLPKRTRIPGRVILTASKAFYPDTGLLEEIIELESMSDNGRMAA